LAKQLAMCGGVLLALFCKFETPPQSIPEVAVCRLVGMQALKHMQQDKTDRGSALREAGMRQHDRIIDIASAVSHST
jgi:predicted RNase H-like nuclease